MSYSSVVLADSPVLYLHLDETSGSSFTDSSGNSHTGTGTSVTVGSTELIDGASGKAATFDGTNSQIDSGVWNLGSASWSFECWLKLTGSGSSGYKTLVKQGTSGAGRVYILIDPSDHLYRWSGADSGFVITRDVVHHVVYTYNSSSFAEKFYVDGTLVGTVNTGSSSGVNDSIQSVYFAKNNDGHPFQGVLDELALYTVELSSTQVSDHYDAGHLTLTPKTGTEAPTVSVTDTSSVTILTVKSATDTPTASLTESSSAAIVGLAIGTSDNPAISHTGTAVVTAATPVSGSDTPTLSVTDSGALAGTVPVVASDTLTLKFAEERSGGTEPIATRFASAYLGG